MTRFDADKAARAVLNYIVASTVSPPLNDFERGFLGAMLVIYVAGNGKADVNLSILEEVAARRAAGML
jgi:hypothetical protein